jgi:hypothetical protein
VIRSGRLAARPRNNAVNRPPGPPPTIAIFGIAPATESGDAFTGLQRPDPAAVASPADPSQPAGGQNGRQSISVRAEGIP